MLPQLQQVLRLFPALLAAAAALIVPVGADAGSLAQVRSSAVAVYNHPGGKILTWVSPQTVFGSRETFAVLARRRSWLQVTSDRLADNVFGWVSAADVKVSRNAYQIHVSLSKHLLQVVQNGRSVRSFKVGTGAATSPTPTGIFAISDKLSGARYGSFYGCCILALTGTQPHPPSAWTGGTRLAIHGGGGIGGSVSAGCIHATEVDLRYLMHTVPDGTLVIIRR